MLSDPAKLNSDPVSLIGDPVNGDRDSNGIDSFTQSASSASLTNATTDSTSSYSQPDTASESTNETTNLGGFFSQHACNLNPK